MPSFHILARETLVAAYLAVSYVSGESVVNLLIGDSSIGESDVLVLGGKGLEGSIVGVDSTATTYDVNCATTMTVFFPFSTPPCVGGEHITITQGPSTALMSQVYTTVNVSKNFREGCTFANSDTVTCSLTNTISETLLIDGSTSTTSYTETSSGVHASPSNGPLYFSVTITAGQEKLTSFHASSTPAATTSSTPSGSTRLTATGKWGLAVSLFVMVYFGF